MRCVCAGMQGGSELEASVMSKEEAEEEEEFTER